MMSTNVGESKKGGGGAVLTALGGSSGNLGFPYMLALTRFTEHLSVALFGSNLFCRVRLPL